MLHTLRYIYIYNLHAQTWKKVYVSTPWLQWVSSHQARWNREDKLSINRSHTHYDSGLEQVSISVFSNPVLKYLLYCKFTMEQMTYLFPAHVPARQIWGIWNKNVSDILVFGKHYTLHCGDLLVFGGLFDGRLLTDDLLQPLQSDVLGAQVSYTRLAAME